MAAVSDLADALYWEEVARARAMDPAERLLEGPRLFERACRVMSDGIRHRHPELSAEDVRAKLHELLERLRAVDG